MRDIMIGPGMPCWDCGEVYGQHTPECPNGKRQRKEAAQQKAEDAISKRALLRRIEALEAAILKKRAQ